MKQKQQCELMKLLIQRAVIKLLDFDVRLEMFRRGVEKAGLEFGSTSPLGGFECVDVALDLLLVPPHIVPGDYDDQTKFDSKLHYSRDYLHEAYLDIVTAADELTQPDWDKFIQIVGEAVHQHAALMKQ